MGPRARFLPRDRETETVGMAPFLVPSPSLAGAVFSVSALNRPGLGWLHESGLVVLIRYPGVTLLGARRLERRLPPIVFWRFWELLLGLRDNERGGFGM